MARLASSSTRSLPDVARMSLDPVPFEIVPLRERVELLPQILVLHGLLVRGLPAARLPLRQPLEHALAHVLRIRVDASTHRPLERLERADHRGELHAVVSGGGFGAGNLALVLTEQQQRRPAARPRIAATGAVRVDLDVAHNYELSRGVVGLTRPPMGCARSRTRGRIGVSVYTRLRAFIR